jgi:predicted CoA-substrate-specific enzyme activase
MAKFALVEDDGTIIRLAACETIRFYKRHGRLEGDCLVLDIAGSGLLGDVSLENAPMVVTGYGRNTVPLRGGKIVSEIRAHVAGAIRQTGLADFTLLDMGGQDTKVARVKAGRLDDFVMNDKCAASSGRYLENMAAVLEVSLEELANHWEDPVPLDSTCGIFGESELIGQILRGHSLPRLCAGVNQTLVKRVLPMLQRFPAAVIVATGGVARNRGLLELLRQSVSARILVPPEPQHNGAIGCAALATP